MSRLKTGCIIATVVAVILVVALVWGAWALTGHGSIVYRGIGWLCADSQSYRPAADWYGKAVRAQPRDADLRVELARVLVLDGRPDEALKQYEEAARLDPKRPESLLGIVRLRTKAGDLAQAQQALDAAMKLSPNQAEAQLALGRLRAAQGKLPEAVAALQQAVAANASLTEAYAELGQALEKQKKTDEAIKAYESGALGGDQACRSRLIALGRTPPTSSTTTSTTTVSSSGSTSTRSSTSSSGQPPAAFFGFMGVFWVAYFLFIGLAILLAMASRVVSLLAIYDCARRDFDDPGTRALWCVLIALLRWIGALVYYLVVYRKDHPPIQPKRSYTSPPPPMT